MTHGIPRVTFIVRISVKYPLLTGLDSGLDSGLDLTPGLEINFPILLPRSAKNNVQKKR